MLLAALVVLYLLLTVPVALAVGALVRRFISPMEAVKPDAAAGSEAVAAWDRQQPD